MFDNGTKSIENKEMKVKQVKENKGNRHKVNMLVITGFPPLFVEGIHVSVYELAAAYLQTQKQTQFPTGTAGRPSKMWEKETGATGAAVSQWWCVNMDRFGDEGVEAVVRAEQVLSLSL